MTDWRRRSACPPKSKSSCQLAVDKGTLKTGQQGPLQGTPGGTREGMQAGKQAGTRHFLDQCRDVAQQSIQASR